MHVRVVEIKVKVWEQHEQWQTPLSQLFMQRVDQVYCINLHISAYGIECD